MNKLRVKGSIGDLMDKIEVLQNNSWIDNRTRAVISEFNVYNAQVEIQNINTQIIQFGGKLMFTFGFSRKLIKELEEAKNYIIKQIFLYFFLIIIGILFFVR